MSTQTEEKTQSTRVSVVKRSTDGGYHALRGFTYQFDHSLLTVFSNPTIPVQIEFLEDESYENHCVQIKYREFTTYAPSAIRKPIQQLIKLSCTYPDKKFILHCHFKDCSLETKVLTLKELNTILGDSATEFEEDHKKHFIHVFKLRFAEDYRAQFENVIKSIRETFECGSESLAVEIHALLQVNLIKIAQRKLPCEREITLTLLKDLVSRNKEIIFRSSYRAFLGTEQYLKFLRSTYFTFHKSSISNYKRLFIVECDSNMKLADAMDLVICISQKYYRPRKSQAPYICLRNCQMLNQIKRELWDANVLFEDGTNFHGDRFRIDQLLEARPIKTDAQIKIVDEAYLAEVVTRLSAHDIFDLFITSESVLQNNSERLTRIEIEKTEEVKRLIKI